MALQAGLKSCREDNLIPVGIHVACTLFFG